MNELLHSGYLMRFVVAANLLGFPAISIPVSCSFPWKNIVNHFYFYFHLTYSFHIPFTPLFLVIHGISLHHQNPSAIGKYLKQGRWPVISHAVGIKQKHQYLYFFFM